MPGPEDKEDLIGDVFTPIFIVLILAEMILIRYKGTKQQSFSDSLASMTSGLLQSLWMRNVKYFAPMLPYAFLYEHYRLYDPPLDSWWCAALLFVVIDLLYYFGHRLSHSSTFVWSGHYVHHSSEYYNFTTAIRQGVFEAALLWPRHLIFALAGFPPVYWLVWNEINFGMMFFVHTEQIGKLWWPIELVFNTPSHHRVHHARNPLYIDKNYAGIFIVWDRMFGTFEEEKEKCVYGLVHPIHYVDPLQMQFAHMRSVLADAASAKSLSTMIGKVVYGPGWYWDEQSKKWREHELPSVARVTGVELAVDCDARRFPYLRIYTLVQFALFLGAGVAITTDRSTWNLDFLIVTALLTYSSIVIAGLMSTRDGHESEKLADAPNAIARLVWRAGDDSKTYIRRAESTRCAVTIACAFLLTSVSDTARLVIIALAVASLIAAFVVTSTTTAATSNSKPSQNGRSKSPSGSSNKKTQ
jgi:sterol desaturase/sphingolipid hydroxylase (fatty acid hydroxylase superfamily)